MPDARSPDSLDLRANWKAYRRGVTTFWISQLAERVGLPPTTLRFYEQAGLLPAQRSESGYRVYGPDAIERVAFIKSGKRLGLPLEEIRDLLGVWTDGPCTEVRSRLRGMVLARIAEAAQRTAELDAFTDHLHRTLAELDRPAGTGRCEPGCGCLTDTRTQPGTEPLACTLTENDRADRVRDWQRLGGHAVAREQIDGGLRVTLPAALAGDAATLAAAEQRCCPFFDFTLHLAGDHVHLEVRAPDEATNLLAGVLSG